MQFDTRVDVERVLAQDLGALRGRAVADLVAATEGLLRWADRVRDPHAPYRFRWAVESLRAADVASTSYILNRLVDAGAIDRVLTAQQRRDGRRWIRSLETAPESYEDPALLAYKPPRWDDAAEPWPPTAAHKEAMNQYARGCLRGYGDLSLDAINGPPPPDWPQQDQADQVLAWIQGVEPNWSWIGRMIRRLMDWYLAGTHGPGSAAGVSTLGLQPAGSAHRLLGGRHPDHLQDHHRSAGAAGAAGAARRAAGGLRAGHHVRPRLRQ